MEVDSVANKSAAAAIHQEEEEEEDLYLKMKQL